MSNSNKFRTVPPNILFLTETEEEFQTAKSFFKPIIGNNSYTIYRLPLNDLKKSLWMQNCILLVEFESKLNEKIRLDSVLEFLKSDGNVISFPSFHLEKDIDIKFIEENCELNISRKNQLIIEILHEQNPDFLFSKKKLKPLDLPNEAFYLYESPLFNGKHLICKYPIELNEQNIDFNKRIFSKLFEENFNINISNSGDDLNRNEDLFCIFTRNSLLQSTSVIESYLKEKLKQNANFVPTKALTQEKCFDSKLFFQNLKTRNLGSIVLFTEQTCSTMNTFNNLPNQINNALVIAKQQKQGQGTNKNEWLSPLGCCMFTIFLNLKNETFSSARLSLLQFAGALSCVKAIKSEFKSLPIEIKWPNDIFFNRSIKLGGVLVKSSMMGDSFFVKLGVGFNLDNEKPTECLNKILREKNLPALNKEIFISRFLNNFEVYMEKLSSNSHDLNEFLNEFAENWMHQNQKIKVDIWNEFVEIIGINEFGYLKIKKQDNSEHFLQPDGNRFDMLQNMIVFRT